MSDVSANAVLRTEIPVDDEWHTVDLGGPVLHVATRSADVVEVWHLARPQRAIDATGPRAFRVFLTGQALPTTFRYVGTCVPASEIYQPYHLMER